MSLAHFLLGQSRSAVLSTLFLRPEAALHVRELARLTGVSPGSLHRELRNLAAMGLLLRQKQVVRCTTVPTHNARSMKN